MPLPLHMVFQQRNKAVILAQTLLGGAGLLYAVYGMDWKTLLNALESFRIFPMFIVFFGMLLNIALMGYRLYFILEKSFNIRESEEATILSCGYNNILPAKGGDIVKFLFLYSKGKLPGYDLATLLIWERVLDVFMLFLLWLFLFIHYAEGEIFVPCVILLALIGVFLGMRRFSTTFYNVYRCLPLTKVGAFLLAFHKRGIVEVRLPWLIINIILSLFCWGVYYACFYLTIDLVGNGNISWIHVLVVFAITCTGMAIPSSPGGIGIFEAGMIFGLSQYGFSREGALPLALFLHAVYFFPPAVMALLLSLKLPARCGEDIR